MVVFHLFRSRSGVLCQFFPIYGPDAVVIASSGMFIYCSDLQLGRFMPPKANFDSEKKYVCLSVEFPLQLKSAFGNVSVELRT